MNQLFQNVLTASFRGSIVIAAVLMLRMILKKAPKKFLCLLWLLAFVRLMMPFEIRSQLSLQPEPAQIAPSIRTEPPQASVQYDLAEPVPAVPEDAALPPDTGVVYADAFTPPESIPEGLEGYYPSPEEQTGEPLVINRNVILLSVWLTVSCALAGYGLLACGKLKRRVREAVRAKDGAWECAGLETAFVLGWLRPRIYIPMGLPEIDRRYILAHERVHMRRGDHWCKLLAYLALVIHWFNPFVWAAYALLCRDMEMACDEQVVKDMGLEERKAYSRALLTCSANHRSLAACPVAFGETDVKGRIQNVLNYRKPAFWLSLIAVVTVVFVAVCLLTSPAEPEDVEPVPETTETTPGQEETISQPTKPAELQITYEDYEYRYEGRDREWEEDVVAAAQVLLKRFPALQDYYFLQYVPKLDRDVFMNHNEYYDGTLRAAFLEEIDSLLTRIPELDDVEVQYELKRIVATLGCSSTVISLQKTKAFPLTVKELEYQGETGLYVVRIAESHPELLYQELIAIDGIPVETVMDLLRPYVSNENEYIENEMIINSYLTHADALRIAGVVEKNGDSADFLFADKNGTEVTVTLDALPYEQTQQTGLWDDFETRQITLYQQEDNYWYQMMEEDNAVYIRIASCWQMEGNSSAEFFREVLERINTAENPLKVIIDLRQNPGGTFPMEGYNDFSGGLIAAETDDIYVLTDNRTGGAANYMAFHLMRSINDIIYVGTPTSNPPENFGENYYYTLPNSQLKLTVATKAYDYYPDYPYDALMPNILVYQNLDDYRRGIDTVLEAALAD